jgi:hypothetical protein
MDLNRLSDGTLPHFADGGYPIVYLTADGGFLCPFCANRSEAREGHEDKQWNLVGCDIHWEGPPAVCDNCNAEIDSAYGDPTGLGPNSVAESTPIILWEDDGWVDRHGCKWVEFSVDYLALQEDGECTICGATLSRGWLCLDGGGEVCSDHVTARTEEHIAEWESDGFRLDLYDTGRVDRRGQTILAYDFWDGDALIFQGSDFAGSPLHADDSPATIGTLLGWLSLRPGDTDKDYFADYTPAQLAWCQERGELLGILAQELSDD